MHIDRSIDPLELSVYIGGVVAASAACLLQSLQLPHSPSGHVHTAVRPKQIEYQPNRQKNGYNE